MSKSRIVTLHNPATNGPAIRIISERISSDGRERHENGVDLLEPGESQDFVIHAKQSLRILAGEDAPEVSEVAASEETQPSDASEAA